MMMASRQPQRAITIIEVIVVISGIAIILALIIPAVQSARESARRINCQSNLRQIGLALQNYHAVHNSLPLGSTKSPMSDPSDTKPWGGWSVHAQILPYLEHYPLYNTINFAWAADGATDPVAPAYAINLTSRDMVVNNFLCPSDTAAGIERKNSYYASYGTTTTVMTDNPDPFSASHRPTGSSGMFALWECYKLGDCTDGTANTVAFSEALVGSIGVQNNSTSNVVVGVTDTMPSAQVFDANNSYTTVNRMLRRCEIAFDANLTIRDDKGHFWSNGATNYTLFNTLQTPNDVMFPFGGCRINFACCNSDRAFSAAANSNHIHGVNVLKVDGSVGFIKDSVNRVSWWSLGTKSGGEVGVPEL